SEPPGLVGGSVGLEPQPAARDVGPVHDPQGVQRRAGLVHALRTRDDARVDAEQLVGFHVEPGLLAQLTPHGDLRSLAVLQASTGHRPSAAPAFRPACKQNPVLLVGADGVGAETMFYVYTLMPPVSGARRGHRSGIEKPPGPSTS